MSDTYDLIVIGGGSAGLVAAGGAAVLGAKVALIEKNLLGGDCLYTGCVPSKTLIRSARFARHARVAERFGFEPQEPRFRDGSFASVTGRVARVVETIARHDSPEVFEEMGVEVVFGAPRFVGPREIEVALKEPGGVRLMKSKRFCIATGSRPSVPPVEGLAEAGFVTNEQVFALAQLPARLVVLGGGAIGMELGQAFSRLGSRVTIVEAGKRVLAVEDEEVSALMTAQLAEEGVTILTRTKALRARRIPGGAKCVTVETDGVASEIEADEILVATGRRPNVEGLGLENAGVRFDKDKIETDDYLRTSRSHIFAAGDVTGRYRFTHMADYEARIVVQNAFVPFPFRKKADYRVVPWATFTDPEIARVGLIESEARSKFGSGVRTYRASFADNDRAQAEDATAGFAKIVTHRQRIVGATLAGEHAGELINDFVWAVKRRMKVSELNDIIRVYPTLAKITQAVGTEATLESLKSPFVQKWFARYLKIWR